MKELLDRLNQVDPTTYEKIVSGIPIYPRSTYYVFDPGTRKPRAEMCRDGWIRFADLPKEVACAWLQACVQDAILARGWHFQLMCREGSCMVDITIFRPKCDIIDGPERESPAEAMLAAYIAACEKKSLLDG